MALGSGSGVKTKLYLRAFIGSGRPKMYVLSYKRALVFGSRVKIRLFIHFESETGIFLWTWGPFVLDFVWAICLNPFIPKATTNAAGSWLVRKVAVVAQTLNSFVSM